ncbi:NAD(P)-dependent oxidoreductase [Tahibacter sp.]|uniref:NAD(P)-dependent oxidoreductase n=1 Tax=Tahibacter sp. TaxID=2056211 RepID=UPI0028C396EE|nr:NAD(P)-dependent oxidoreductase [Tahibacter sp.]
MNVVLFGATGKTGSRLLQELVTRGHTVTASARDVSKLSASSAHDVRQDDLSDAGRIAETIRGAGAVISAYAPPADDTDQLVGVTQRQVDAVRRAGVARLLVVGGAGGLNVAPGVSLIDSGHLPAPYLPIARSHVKALDVLRTSNVDWTYLAPAAFFEPGERKGRFRLGTDELITDANGESRISMEDYAIALVDELEQGAHRKQRFSIGY